MGCAASSEIWGDGCADVARSSVTQWQNKVLRRGVVGLRPHFVLKTMQEPQRGAQLGHSNRSLQVPRRGTSTLSVCFRHIKLSSNLSVNLQVIFSSKKTRIFLFFTTISVTLTFGRSTSLDKNKIKPVFFCFFTHLYVTLHIPSRSLITGGGAMVGKT